MPYLPHALAASSRDLAARIVGLKVKDKGSSHVPRYQLYVDVELSQTPTKAVIKGIKYYAPIVIVTPNNTLLQSRPGNYDEIVQNLLGSLGSLSAVEAYLLNQLKYKPIMVQSIGGVWVSSQV